MRKLDHVAVVVNDLEEALSFYRDQLRMEVTQRRLLPEEGVRVAFLAAGESHIELLQPVDPESGVARFLRKKGEGLHHICLQVEDIDAVVRQLVASGAGITGPVREGAHGKVVFVHPRSAHGVLIELLQPVEEAASAGNMDKAQTK